MDEAVGRGAGLGHAQWSLKYENLLQQVRGEVAMADAAAPAGTTSDRAN